MIKLSQNCLNFGSLKEKQPQNVLIVAMFLRAGKIRDMVKLKGQKMQLSLYYFI